MQIFIAADQKLSAVVIPTSLLTRTNAYDLHRYGLFVVTKLFWFFLLRARRST